jgi:hypothetical protein
MKGLPKIVVALDVDCMDDATVCNNAKGVKTAGDADVTNPPVTDAVLKTEADDVVAIIQKRVTDQSASLTKAQGELASKVRWSYTKVGQYVGQVANDVARAQGNVEAGEKVVLRCGFKLKKKGVLPPRDFEVVDSGVSWIHIRVKSLGKKAGYLWRFGKTTKKGIMPVAPLTTFFTMECEIIIDNLESADVMGFQSATILPVGLGSKKSTKKGLVQEDASKTPSMGSKKPTLSADSDPYNWSDFIYHVCE